MGPKSLRNAFTGIMSSNRHHTAFETAFKPTWPVNREPSSNPASRLSGKLANDHISYPPKSFDLFQRFDKQFAHSFQKSAKVTILVEGIKFTFYSVSVQFGPYVNHFVIAV